ncbi:winged helix-turn-helix domain-containing protein [Streptomyces coeruleorubidus]|uniref:ArsR/SmtB family transcription factor n=1 Tax=Streptomyces coeruleorubidus TaxID=116188 RepID=UPI00237FA0B2|nr:winged helix-turn-helix domain-containing protein [Streptomyces coeruleorubidus]WDV52296.1 winged helix-turn-helix domain-containing protein [Streptomyces coeruleorubidus]
MSLHQLARPFFFFTAWARRTRMQLAAQGMGAEVGLLTSLVPPTGYFPDFLTPATTGPVADLETGIDAVLSTGTRRLHGDISRLAAGQARPAAWLDDLAHGRPPALRRLGAALRRYHQVVLAPHAEVRAALVGTDLQGRARRLLDDGSEALLARLGPTLRWRPPVLEADYPVDRDLRLDGRGLTVIPSLYAHHLPITLADPALQPVLVYPVARGELWLPDNSVHPSPTALDELLGPTRAVALRCLDTPHTTTSLAARLNTSPSTASRHAAVLRRAALVTTERTGTSVLHTRTALGTALVHGAGPMP